MFEIHWLDLRKHLFRLCTREPFRFQGRNFTKTAEGYKAEINKQQLETHLSTNYTPFYFNIQPIELGYIKYKQG